MHLSNVQSNAIPNKMQCNRYHCINMSDLCSDLKNTSLIKFSAFDVVDTLNNMYIIWMMLLTGMHGLYID